MSNGTRVMWTGLLSVLGIVAVLVGIAWGVRYIAQVRDELEQKKQRKIFEAQREELQRAIEIVGAPLSESPSVSSLDLDTEAARLLAIHKYDSLEFKNRELTNVWSHIEVNSEHGLGVLKTISDIERRMPSLLDAATDTIKALNELSSDDDERKHPEYWNTGITYAQLSEDRAQEQEEFRTEEFQLDRSLGELQDVAKSVFPGAAASGSISADYLPSWEGRFNADEVTIQNNSGVELDRVPVFVTVHMNDGRTFVHVHYAGRWQNGSTLKALYASKSTAYANSQAVENPQSVDVAVYTPDGEIRTSYALTAQEWDRKVMQYCSDLNFHSEFLNPFNDPQGRGQHPGFKLQFSGLPSLPVEYVDVWFRWNNGDVRSVRVPSNLLQTDDGYAATELLRPGVAYNYRGTELEIRRTDGTVAIPDQQIFYSVKIRGSGYLERRQSYPADSRVN